MIPVLLVLLLPACLLASYRQFGFQNHDLCSEEEKGKSLQLGAGAALLSLDGFGAMETFLKCSVKIEADEGLGLMVYVEEMHLRIDERPGVLQEKSCIDYVQFGRDDLIPFFTISKSEKLCGNRTGFVYDEPGGKLLVWLNIGPGRANNYRESAQNDRLTVVVTAYKHLAKEESTNFRLCSVGSKAIRKEYFCDQRINCALDKIPGDERPEICRHNRGSAQDGEYDNPTGDWNPPLNLVSITLVLVSGVVLLVLILLLAARMRRSGWFCFRRPLNIDCELPERAVGVTRAAAGHRAGAGLVRVMNSGEQENLFRPAYLEPRQDPGLILPRGTTPEAEPPPAYHDLFPAGYKFDPEKVPETSQNLLSSKPEESIELQDLQAVPEYGELQTAPVEPTPTSGGSG